MKPNRGILLELALCCWLIAGGIAHAVEPDFAALIDKYGGAVVNIRVALRDVPPEGGEDRGGSSPRDESERPSTASFGSGFIISGDGYILTSAHVVENATDITVKLRDKREFSARVVGADVRSDVALLKISAHGLPVAKIGDPAGLRVGDWVLAIGSPFGFEYSASTGIVSAKGRSLPDEQYIPFIQTDAAINPGNSGGPLFNMNGEVVGINAQIFSQTGGFMGLSFAVPIDLAIRISDQLKKNGYFRWGWLGCAIQDVDRELARAFRIDRPAGALITDILTGGPAFRSALKIGDIVVRFEGRPIELSSDLPPMVGVTPPDTRAELQIIRDGERKTVHVTIGELNTRPSTKPQDQRTGRPPPAPSLGLVLAELSVQDRKLTKLTYGVLVTGVAPGPAYAAGLQPGDIILELDGKRIHDPDAFFRLMALQDGSRPLPLRIRRGQQSMYLALGSG